MKIFSSPAMIPAFLFTTLFAHSAGASCLDLDLNGKWFSPKYGSIELTLLEKQALQVIKEQSETENEVTQEGRVFTGTATLKSVEKNITVYLQELYQGAGSACFISIEVMGQAKFDFNAKLEKLKAEKTEAKPDSTAASTSAENPPPPADEVPAQPDVTQETYTDPDLNAGKITGKHDADDSNFERVTLFSRSPIHLRGQISKKKSRTHLKRKSP